MRSEYELTPAKGIVFFEEFSFDLNLKTNGLSIGFNKGKISKYYLTKYYNFDIAYVRDPKERQKSRYLQGFNGISSYIFGKQNEFLNIKAGVGRKYYLSEKALKRGVAMGFTFEGGFSMGLLKPYYLILEYTDELDQTFREEAYTAENAHLFLDENKIRDKAGFFNGWDKLQMVPGAYTNVAAHFSLGAYEKYIKAIEVGFQIDSYIKRIPMMIETETQKNQFIFASFFVNVQLGKRWR